MDLRELFDLLWTWTPYLAGGFAWNILVSFAAMAIGTALGAGLAWLRLGRARPLAGAARGLTSLSRNLPTFVCLFYLAFLVPHEVTILGAVIAIAPWVKASLALAIAVTGYISDTLGGALAELKRGRSESIMLFVPAWFAYFLVIVMASSTGSVIGVSEIVSRANTVIGATGRDDLMVWVYLYTMLWFLGFCWPLSLLMQRVQQRLRARALLRPAGMPMGMQPAR